MACCWETWVRNWMTIRISPVPGRSEGWVKIKYNVEEKQQVVQHDGKVVQTLVQTTASAFLQLVSESPLSICANGYVSNLQGFSYGDNI